MIVQKKYNGKLYTLSNEDLKVGDRVYGISWGKVTNGKYEHWYFEWRNFVSGWLSEPHTIVDLHYSDYKPYEIHTDHGYSPRECYFKIIKTEKL